ncbi:MAG: ACT domain-containing protein [Candidatus Thorarchaeota archaeon]|jgi:hypothetical protein
MTGIRDLTLLLKDMSPEYVKGEFVFCTASSEIISSWTEQPLMTFEEVEGTTVIVTKDFADDNGLVYDAVWGMITLSVHSDLEAIGLLAAVTKVLAKEGIPVNAVSAYYHDHLFVPVDEVQAAVAILDDLSHGD